MNQILVSEKLYVTPELKRKKRLHKINLFASIFLVFVLCSYCIYAEYDRTKKEKISKEILSTIDLSKTEKKQEDTTQKKKDEVLIVILDENAANNEIEQKASDLAVNVEQNNHEVEKFTTDQGTQYYTTGVLSIPKIDITYPIIASDNQTSSVITELLKISLTKYWGPDPNQVGNLCIVGHNYNNKKFFGRLSELENGDLIELTDNSNKTVKYSVYDSYIVNPTEMECTSQITDGKTEITLITCTPNGKQRLVVKARALII